jgi:hypothetical protein
MDIYWRLDYALICTFFLFLCCSRTDVYCDFRWHGQVHTSFLCEINNIERIYLHDTSIEEFLTTHVYPSANLFPARLSNSNSGRRVRAALHCCLRHHNHMTDERFALSAIPSNHANTVTTKRASRKLLLSAERVSESPLLSDQHFAAIFTSPPILGCSGGSIARIAAQNPRRDLSPRSFAELLHYFIALKI